MVATLMTDLQPYALNTRLSCVNFYNSTVTWEGETVTSEILFSDVTTSVL